MKRILVFAFLLTQVSFASPATAEVFQRDWKTSGDGLLTFDTVNKLEWLDLSQTLLQQFPGSTIEDQYQSVLAELAPSGVFEDFILAKREDVTALAQSAGIDTTTQNHSINSGPTTVLGELLGFTVPSSLTSVGLIDEFQTPQDTIPLSAVVWTLSSQAGLVFGKAHAQFGSPPGVMLFRSVPEPSVSMLIGWGVCSFNLCWRHFARRSEKKRGHSTFWRKKRASGTFIRTITPYPRHRGETSVTRHCTCRCQSSDGSRWRASG